MKSIKAGLKILITVWIIVFMFVLVEPVAFGAESDEVLTMKYDDYFTDIDYSTVEIILKGEPESYKVGYGVKEGTKDDAVVTVENGVLHAVGIGTATVKLDDVQYDVTVEAAPISMFLMIGQSNMYGSQGNADQSVVNKNGTVYSSFGMPQSLTEKNAQQFVSSALSGEGANVTVTGKVGYLSQSPVNCLTDAGNGKVGLDSAFAKKWYELTGNKVWLINAGHGGTAISNWVKGATEYNEAVALFKAAQQVMKKEITAGHYVLVDYAYFWFHGCSDRPNTAEYYVETFLTMHENLKNDLAFDIDADGEKEVFDFCDIIMPRAGTGDCVGYRDAGYTDSTDKAYEYSFYDLEMRGQRVGLYWIANNPELTEFNLVCNIGDEWVYMPDGSDGVQEYFSKKYPNGRVNYPIQVEQPESWYTPKTPEDVHPTMHYSQIGYNEIGFEAAQNSAYTHHKIEKPKDVKRTVTFYDWTGYREVSNIDACEWADSGTLVVPVVYPVWESKNITYCFSDNLEYKYYDLTAKNAQQGGTLVSEGASKNKMVTVSCDNSYVLGGNAYYWEGSVNGLEETKDSMYSKNSITSIATSNGKGTVENGVHKKMAYILGKTVNLLHDKEWSIEWSGSSAQENLTRQSFMLLSENLFMNIGSQAQTKYFWKMYEPSTSKLYFSLGTKFTSSNTYSNEVLQIYKYVTNPVEKHVYRIYNEIDKNGTNRVCLSVDGIYCGEYKQYSGKDFSFRFIGASGYEIDNYIFDYMKILEDSYCDIFGHSYCKIITEPTCQKTGYTTYSCACGDSYITDKTDIVSHKMLEYIDLVPATCTENGTQESFCVYNCGLTAIRTTPKTGHVYSYEKLNATCTENGYKRYICECGDVYVQSALTKFGHNFKIYTSDMNATYTFDGTKTSKCTRCTATKTVADSGSKLVLGHVNKVSATQNSSSVSLSWDKVKDARGYRIFEFINGSWKTVVSATSENEYTLSSLAQGSKHQYAVRAYIVQDNKVIWGDKYTQITTCTTPPAPEVFSVESGFGFVSICWNQIENITGYRVYKLNSQNGKWEVIVKSTNLLSSLMTDLVNGESYVYAVRGYIKVGDTIVWGPYSKINITTMLTSPELRVASTASGRATLAWSEYENVTGYQVYYSTNPIYGYTKIANYTPETIKTYVTSLNSSETYYFKVRAYMKTESGYVYSGFSNTEMLKIK